MKYSVTIQELSDSPEGQSYRYTERTIYEQKVEVLDVWGVIIAVNRDTIDFGSDVTEAIKGFADKTKKDTE